MVPLLALMMEEEGHGTKTGWALEAVTKQGNEFSLQPPEGK